jgi:hypothetical protein
MTKRRTTTNDALPFGPDDFLEVFEHKYVTGAEWEVIRKHWRQSYYEDRRKALGEFVTGKLPGAKFSLTLADARHKELGGRRGPITVSGNAKLLKLAARALFVRHRLAYPVAPEEDARRHAIDALSDWAAASTVYGYLVSKAEPAE